MLRRIKAVIATALAAAAMAAPVPASAVDTGSVTAGPCRADVGTSYEEWYQTVYVTGAFAPVGATHVWFECGVVRYGETVAYVGSVTEDGNSPVGVVAGEARVHAGPISVCYEATVLYSERYEYHDTCP